MAKCVYNGKGIKPDCEHCIDTIGTGMVCTHDCIIELREVIEKKDALIKELAGALDDCATMCGDFQLLFQQSQLNALVAKARDVIGENRAKDGAEQGGEGK